MLDLIIKLSFFILLSCLITSSVIGQSTLCNSSDSSKCYGLEKFTIPSLIVEKKVISSVLTGPFYTPFVADIDGDCIPDIILKSNFSDSLFIIDSKYGNSKWAFPIYQGTSDFSNLVIVDINNDSIPEIINHSSPLGNMISTPTEDRLICYRIDGSIVWISDSTIRLNTFNSGAIGVADFNQDGNPEVYISNQIFNARTGVKLCDGGNNGKGDNIIKKFSITISVAADLDNDSLDLELAAGYTIYDVQINNINGIAGNQMIAYNQMINGQFEDGPTSIADINLDGRLDVIVSVPGADNTAILYVYYLDQMDKPRLLVSINPLNFNNGFSSRYISHASVGYIDKSGMPSILVGRPNLLLSYKYNGTPFLKLSWSLMTTDSSGGVGIGLFDFNGDGIQEVVYRDMTHIKIIDGSSKNPFVISQSICYSPTAYESMTIADIDNTKNAKICVTCTDGYTGYRNARLTIFGPPDGQYWAPARPIWNQYTYNPLFINDDLTVPRIQKNQATYKNGKYNNFMQQESYVDSNGMVKKPAASLSGRINCVNYDINKKAYHITFDIFNRNNASATADSNLLVSFYSDNPELGVNLIGTYTSKFPINPGDSLLNLEIWITASNLNKLFLVVNSKRNASGSFSDSDFVIGECDYTDNIFQTIDLPKFDTISVEICPGEKYTFYQSVIRNIGQYYHTTNSSKNCDSLITILNLQYKQNCIPNCNNIDSTKCYSFQKFKYNKIFAEKKLESKDSFYIGQLLLLADVDNDCIPEIILEDNDYKNLLIIDSKKGVIKKTINKPYVLNYLGQMALADLDGNGEVELVILASNSGNNPNTYFGRLFCLKLDGTQVWMSDKRVDIYKQFREMPRGAIGFADFNQDGKPEVYVNNKIFNGETGVLLCDGGSNGLGLEYAVDFSPDGVSVAGQLDDDIKDLELAAGYTIYKVNLINLNGSMGNSMNPHSVMINGKHRDGYTSLSDINKDGMLDVVVTSPGIKNEALVYVYTYNGGNPILIGSAQIPGNDYSGIGEPTISSIGRFLTPSILFTRFCKIYSYHFDGSVNLKLDWAITTTDSSGVTSITTFDLNGDGSNEIIYGDETEFKIFDASSGSPLILYRTVCTSWTSNEVPLVADLDNSGQAKICVICGKNRDDNVGKLTIFGAPDGQYWAPARPIWNQYAYNPLFINDDLTVPRIQKNQATYKNGKYNNFMQQESYVDSNGMVKKAAASLSGRISCINYDVVTLTYSVIFDVYNRKDASQDADTNLIISFYNGDPNTNGIFIGSYHTDQFLLTGDSLLNRVYRFQIMDLKDLFMVVNTKRINNGTFGDQDFIQVECDYTDNISRNIDIPKIEELSASICRGDNYLYFGASLTDSGSYEHKTYKFNGCDSVITILKLNTVDTVHSIQKINTCDAYFWNGQNYTLSGIYSHDTLSLYGCDSSTILNLTINNSNQKNITQSVCDSLIWNGIRLDQSGTYEDRRINISGCDSITTLQLTINPSSSNSIIQSACDHYDWNGQTYDKSGMYTYKGQSIFGCDSIITLNLIIDSIIQLNINETSCNSYSWNNMMFNQSGIYTSKALSQQGCDSITTLDLIINKSTNSTATIRSCDSYDWNGQIYTNSGSYTFLTQNTAGCDSTVNLLLTIDKASSSNTNISTCDSLTWNGTIYSTSGTYTFKTQNVSGCDSIATLNLSIQKSDNISLQQQACDSYLWNGKTYTQSGLYQDKSQNVNGCDSIINLNLIINKSSNVNVTFSVCDSLNYLGKTLNKNGTYLFTLQNSVGCDSVINLDLKILSNSILDKVSTCDNYHWKVNNLDYNQSGLYSQKYINTQGCDSIYTLELNINKSVQLQEQAEVCKEYFWPVNKTIYNQSGDYVVPLKTIEGCDSILKLNLLVNPEYEKTDTVYTNQDYIWSVDHKKYSQSGTYQVDFVSKDGCDSIHILLLSIENEVGIYYPNVIHPGGLNGKFTIYDNGAIQEIETLSIYDRWGELIWQKHHFNSNNIDLGWDGTFKNVNVNPGVYVWHAILKLKDGRLLQEKGDVTVVR
ncbi:MAG: gliding motility-associated C-terminal domain-containing protein [Saprospiraceae bacterium]